MAGRRSTNLRKGDLAEGLGIEMLRSFTAVAPVPRSEDIGIDVVCTLLRPDGVMQYAENSFYVQIKATSVSEIIYRDESYNWLWNLALPIFVASVDIADSSIQIFSMQRVFTRANSSFQGVKVLLGENKEDLDKDICLISLGKPILEWNFNEVSTKEFHKDKYQVMKTWVEHEHENWVLRRANICRELDWCTNKKPLIAGKRFSVDDTRLAKIFEEMYPFLVQLVGIFLKKALIDRKDKDLKILVNSIFLLKLASQYQWEKDPLSVPDVLMMCIQSLNESLLERGISSDEEREKRIHGFLQSLDITTDG